MPFIPSFVSPFWGRCRLGWPFLGFPLKYWLRMSLFLALDSSAFPNKLIWISLTQAVSGRLESIPLVTHAAGIDSESTHDSSVFPDIDSDRLMTQNASRFFLFKPTHGSSKKHLILNRLMIRLWVTHFWLLRTTSVLLRSLKYLHEQVHLYTHLIKPIYSLPLAHRRKGVLLILN